MSSKRKEEKIQFLLTNLAKLGKTELNLYTYCSYLTHLSYITFSSMNATLTYFVNKFTIMDHCALNAMLMIVLFI